ncbi:hypothetical protein [Nocardia pseudovaccinii]|uniref:hypothetical protein n=1 Tax=Nocardia pseudovaccinii TaxID=189540 RepID=UPI0007A3F3EC|nr:hypothetical protein [Nocardia pseudovaccinii]
MISASPTSDREPNWAAQRRKALAAFEFGKLANPIQPHPRLRVRTPLPSADTRPSRPTGTGPRRTEGQATDPAIAEAQRAAQQFVDTLAGARTAWWRGC